MYCAQRSRLLRGLRTRSNANEPAAAGGGPRRVQVVEPAPACEAQPQRQKDTVRATLRAMRDEKRRIARHVLQAVAIEVQSRRDKRQAKRTCATRLQQCATPSEIGKDATQRVQRMRPQAAAMRKEMRVAALTLAILASGLASCPRKSRTERQCRRPTASPSPSEPRVRRGGAECRATVGVLRHGSVPTKQRVRWAPGDSERRAGPRASRGGRAAAA